MSAARRVEVKYPGRSTKALIEQTPDGLLWLGNGGDMTSLTAGQIRTLRTMLNHAVADTRHREAIRLNDGRYVLADLDGLPGAMIAPPPRRPAGPVPPLTAEETGPLPPGKHDDQQQAS